MGLLLLIAAVLALAQVAGMVAIQAGRGAGWSVMAQHIRALDAPLLCASPILAGVLIDRFGLRRVVALGLVAWCCIVTAGTAFLSPLALAAVQPLVFALLRGLVLTAGLVALRLAFARRRRAPATAVILIAYDIANAPSFELPRMALRVASSDTVLFGIVTLGTVVAAAWLLVPLEIECESGPGPGHSAGDGVANLLSQPIVWSLIAIRFCHSIASGLVIDPSWTLELLRESAIGGDVLVPVIAAGGGLLAAASWSDWGLRRTRSLSRARQPFVVLGFVAITVASVAGTRPQVSVMGLALLAAIGVGASRLVDILEVDLAPPPMEGRFIGLIGAGEAFLALYVAPIVTSISDDPRMKTPVLITTSLAGAALALVLLRRMPEVGSDRERLFADAEASKDVA